MADRWLLPQGELLERRRRYRIAMLPKCKDGGIHADIWLPTMTISTGSPIVVYVHGGGWVIGAAHDISSAEIEYYNAKGFIVVSLEYRLLPHATLSDMRSDLLVGYRWILENLNAKLDNIADTSRLCLTGCSAGGTLVVFLALDIDAAGLTAPKAVVPVFGILDWSFDPDGAIDDGKSSTSMKILMEQPTETSVPIDPPNQMRYALGGSLIKQGRLVELLLAGCTDKRAPIELLHRHFPPTCLISAGNDELVPKQQTYDVYKVLATLGVDVKLVEWAEGRHAFTAECKNGPGTECWETVIGPACDFAISHTVN